LRWGPRSTVWGNVSDRERFRRREKLHYVKDELVQVASNELINLVENKEADFRSTEASRCSK